MSLSQLTLFLAGFALILQSIENLSLIEFFPESNFLKKIEWLILFFAFGLFATAWFSVLILVLIYVRLLKLQGPINGGSDSMITTVLVGILLNLNPWVQNLGLLYIGANSFLSYLIPGLAKLRNKNWLNGNDLQTIIQFSFYPVPKSVTHFLIRPKLATLASIAVVIFECSIVLGIFIPKMMLVFIPIAFVFHLINAYTLGLHRFTWAWLATFPGLYYFVEKLQQST